MIRRFVFRVLYLLLLFFSAALFYYGRDYYLASLFKRARHPLNPVLRQSGSIGHLLGIVGVIFMLLLLLYSVRKRFRFARRWGDLTVWLSAHIFLGIAGPVLILFHTDFKLSGIVAIAFWAMTLVVVSGFVGRYLFALIPRSLSGMELNRIELEAEEIGITFELRKLLPPSHQFWNHLEAIERNSGSGSRREYLHIIFEPFMLRRRLRRMLAGSTGLNAAQKRIVIRLVVRRHMIVHKAQLLKQTLRILHYWHLVHQPFVIIMFLILAIHVAVAVRMGYTWNF